MYAGGAGRAEEEEEEEEEQQQQSAEKQNQKSLARTEIRARHCEFVRGALGDPVFVPALSELLERGNSRTLCMAADLLSRLYALALSCGPQVSARPAPCYAHVCDVC
jgi:hypothetical protein